MSKSLFCLLGIISYLRGAFAQQSAYGQCGGIGWTGPTSCVSGFTCVYSNDWYSQCVVGSASATAGTTTTSTTSKTTTSTTTSTTPSASGGVAWIVPGAIWRDTAGVKIDAHGGQVMQVGKTFYWIGQGDSNDVQPRMYSSTDLRNWTNRGIQYPISWMWRPKMYQGTSKYYILGQVNRLVQPLSSSSIVGGYSMGTAYLTQPYSLSYSDEGIFKDDDGKWYFLTSADGNIIQIHALNGDGTLGARLTKLGGENEAPGLFRAGNVYFLIVSAKTGYRANPNKVYWSTSLSGPWTGPADIAPPAQNTYGSQNTHELVIKGSSTTTYIYMGDAWDSGGTAASNYMWLPMAVSTSAHTVTLQYYAMWKVDVDTGVVSVPSTGKRYEAERAALSGRAAITECDHCISKRAVHRIDSVSEITFNNVHGTGAEQWISFHYSVNRKLDGEAHIYVNDDPIPRNISEYNSRAGHQNVVPISLTLKHGPVNTIKVGCSGTEGFEIHFDGIEVHED